MTILAIDRGLRDTFRTMLAVEAAVRAGDFFPQPTMLASDEPVSQEGHRHVVLPAEPGTDFVMIHPQIVLGEGEGLLDPVLVHRDLGQGLARGVCMGVGEEEFQLGRGVEAARDDEGLSDSGLFALRAGPHAGGGDVEDLRTLLPISHEDARPGRNGKRLGPIAHRAEGMLRSRTALARGARWGDGVQVTNHGVGGDFQHVALAAAPEGAAEVRGTAKFVIAHGPAVGDARSDPLVEFAGEADFGTEPDLLRDMGGVESGPAAGPLVRKIKIPVHQDGAALAVVGDEDAHLAIVGLSQTVAPLAGDAGGVRAFLGETGAVEHQDPVGVAQISCDLAVKLFANLRVLPFPLTGEALKALAGTMVGDRDGLDRLSMQVAGEPLEVDPRQGSLLLAVEKRREGTGEAVQPADETFDVRWVDPDGFEKLLRDVRNRQRHKPPSLFS